jgi:hypothetical protein
MDNPISIVNELKKRFISCLISCADTPNVIYPVLNRVISNIETLSIELTVFYIIIWTPWKDGDASVVHSRDVAGIDTLCFVHSSNEFCSHP